MNQNLQNALLNEVSLLLAPVTAFAEDSRYRRIVLENMGWSLDSTPKNVIGELLSLLAVMGDDLKTLELLTERPPADFSDFLQSLETTKVLFSNIFKLHNAAEQLTVPDSASFKNFGKDLINYLFVHYLSNRHPLAFHLLTLLTIIEPAPGPLPSEVDMNGSGSVIRFPQIVPNIRLERIRDLLTDPIDTLKNEYFNEETFESAEGARLTADKLFFRLAQVLPLLGLNAVYSIKPMYGVDFGEIGNELIGGMLTTWIDSDLDDKSFGVTLALSPKERGDLGLVVIPFGNLTYSQTLGDWGLDLKLEGAIQGFAIGREGLTLLAAPETTQVAGQLSLVKLPGLEDKAFVIGSATGTRLEIGQLAVMGGVRLSTAEQDYGLLFSVGSAALIIKPEDGDGFLQEILPSEGLRTDFDLAAGWSNRMGFYFHGSAGLDATLPVHTSLMGLLSADAIHLAIQTQNESIQAVVAATVTVQLGPFKAIVERFGIQANLAFPREGGNLGVSDLSLGFKSPNGVTIAIDSEAVVGGGYLFFDPVKEHYAGVLQLDMKGISLNAIGLLTTRLPDVSQGFSLLVCISTEDFTPIKLGFGFTLNGVGGLLGVNRTARVDVLRAGVKNRTLDAVLFPEDPLRNAPQIVSNLRQVFPPKRDQFVFGPMAIIGWGTPTVLTIELGVILEFPSPLRLLILGQFRAFLPSEEKPLVRLQMDALGVVDFDKGEGSVDATLYDSRLMHFALSGDMALRARWQRDPTFVLAVGGLNPNFQPPPGFPKLARMAVSLTKGNNPRLRLEAYLALTSNTVQFGAHLDLFVKMAGFSIEAYLGFDALFQFSPFQFVADFGGGVTLKWHGRTLMGVQLDMTLSGPSLWHARGKATFKVWRFSKSVSFDKRFGSEERPVALPSADPLPELLEALGDKRNWSAQLPGQGHMLVSFRKRSASDEVLVHPLGDLTVRQRVVPLNVEISKFGNTRPRKVTRYTISEVRLNGTRVEETRPAKDHFAPAQYIEMEDSAKISRPSFERMDAGIQIGTAHVTYGGQKEETAGHRVKAPLSYETSMIDVEQETTREEEPYEIPEDQLETLVALGAAAQSPMSRTGRAKYQSASLAVAAAAKGYVIATKNDFTIRDDIPGLDRGDAATYTAAAEALKRYLVAHPEERGKLQVVARHEMKGATP